MIAIIARTAWARRIAAAMLRADA